MIPCIPDFFPDELIGSACARMIKRLRVHGSDIFHLLFGLPNATISWDLPQHLDHFSSIYPPWHTMDLYELIEGHTLYPFYRIFQHRMMFPDNIGHYNRRNFIPEIQDTRYLPSVLRYCPSCAIEDRSRCGERYWHRAHQLPGVYLCPQHNVFLEKTTVPLWSMTAYQCQQASAEQVIGETPGRLIDSANPEDRELLRIAHVMVPLLNPQKGNGLVRTSERKQLRYLVEESFRITIGKSHLLPMHKRVIPPSFVGQAWTQHLV